MNMAIITVKRKNEFENMAVYINLNIKFTMHVSG